MVPEFYTSPEFLKLEEDHLLRRQWMCVGHIGEVPKPGDYFTTELLDEPLLVVHDAKDQARVLSAAIAAIWSPRARATPSGSSAPTTPGPTAQTAPCCAHR